MASILRTDIKVDFCPEGTTGLSLGFQPQVPIRKRPAPKVGGRTVASHLCRRSQTKRRAEHLAPLQGASCFGPFLGLKPQAESYSPFGTSLQKIKKQVENQTPYLSTFSKPHQGP